MARDWTICILRLKRKIHSKGLLDFLRTYHIWSHLFVQFFFLIPTTSHEIVDDGSVGSSLESYVTIAWLGSVILVNLCVGWVCISDFLIVLNMRRVLKCILTNDNVGLFWGDPVQLTGGWNQIANLSSEGIKTNYTILRLKEEGRKLLPKQGFEPRMAISSHVSSINYNTKLRHHHSLSFKKIFYYFRGGGGTFWTGLYFSINIPACKIVAVFPFPPEQCMNL